jgi:hypothetical protein
MSSTWQNNPQAPVFRVKVFLVLMTMVLVVGPSCVGTDKNKRDYSVLKDVPLGGDNVESLNKKANDTAEYEEERARAIFTLFARYITLPCSAAEFRRVMTNTDWLTNSELYKVGAYFGWYPIDPKPGETLFVLYPFPQGANHSNKRPSLWGICFTLTDSPSRDPLAQSMEKKDAIAFFSGNKSRGRELTMREFALCYPHSVFPSRLLGRIEVFSPKGIRAYKEEGNE